MNSNKKTYLFVYGTLRKELNHSMIIQQSQFLKFLGKGEVVASFFDIGEYPGIIPTLNQNELVEGDVFELLEYKKTLKEFDNYEGFDMKKLNDSEDIRKISVIKFENGDQINAWVYWYNFSTENKPKIFYKNYIEYKTEKENQENNSTKLAIIHQ